MAKHNYTVDELIEQLDDDHFSVPFDPAKLREGIVTTLNGLRGKYFARNRDLIQNSKIVGYVRDGIAYLNMKDGRAKVIGTVEYEK